VIPVSVVRSSSIIVVSHSIVGRHAEVKHLKKEALRASGPTTPTLERSQAHAQRIIIVNWRMM
jgi:hypothetical protein